MNPASLIHDLPGVLARFPTLPICSNLLTHAYCTARTSGLVWTMIGADVLTACAYLAIVISIAVFAHRRAVQGQPDRTVNLLSGLFGMFVLGCATVHTLNVWNVWHPYFLAGTITKGLTSVLAVGTAAALWKLAPRMSRMPTRANLQAVIDSRDDEIRRRVLAEEVLQASQTSLALSLASMDAAFISTDRQGRVRHMNAVAERILGWTADAASGQGIWTVFARTDRNAAYLQQNPVDAMLESRLSMDTSTIVEAISLTGERTNVEVRASLISAPDETDEPLGLAMVFRDVGRLVRAEAETERLAAIVDSSLDSIISITLDGTILSWNSAARNLFGYTPGEAIMQSINMLIPQEYRSETISTEIMASVQGGSPIAPRDGIWRTKSGALLSVSVLVSPVLDPHGLVAGISLIVRDVTAQRENEAARHKLEAERIRMLQEDQGRRGIVAAKFADLCAPLDAIVGFSEALQKEEESRTAIDRRHTHTHGHLALIASNGRYLKHLLKDVFDTTGIEPTPLDHHPQPVDLRAFCNELVSMLDDEIQAKQLTVAIDVDASLTDIELDPLRLKRVVYGFLSNAVKFTPNHGNVFIRCYPIDDARFRIEVIDSGAGAAESDQAQLFGELPSPGYLGPERQDTSARLGLTLSRLIAEAQGGTVGVTRMPGVGNTFHVEMDRVQLLLETTF